MYPRPSRDTSSPPRKTCFIRGNLHIEGTQPADVGQLVVAGTGDGGDEGEHHPLAVHRGGLEPEVGGGGSEPFPEAGPHPAGGTAQLHPPGQQVVGAAVDWVRGDALRTPFPARSFDLVSIQYPTLPNAAGEPAVRTLLETVRPGGFAARRLPRPRRRAPRAHEVAGRRPSRLRRCRRPRPATRRRLHGQAARGRAAHRPAARRPDNADVVLRARRR